MLDVDERDLQLRPAFGEVFASSGYKVDDTPMASGLYGCTLDWGLVEVLPCRVGHNEVRSTFCGLGDESMADKNAIQLSNTGRVPKAYAEFRRLHNKRATQEILGTAHIRSGKVCKRGASSGTTFGEVSADCFVLLNQKKHGGRPSHDWIVTCTARDPPFCVPGDSGGWVYDAEGCLVGSAVGDMD